MEMLSLIIAVTTVAAFMRTGGVHELKHQVQALSSTTNSGRDRTADALNRLEQLVRGKDRQKADSE